MTDKNGPPEKERPSGYQAARPDQQKSDNTNICESNAIPRQQRRRRAASWRCPPLDCSCRDPWPCKHYRDPYISDNQAEAAAAAIAHLDLVGTPGLLDIDTCRAMWRIGRRDLAVTVHRRTAGAA
jgi:hypothetical protein